MGDLSTYSLSDFIPFTPEVYFRLFVRVNEAMWPIHLVAAVLGIAAVWGAMRGRGRVVGVVLGVCWAWVGWRFLLGPYAALNWAGSYAGWAFLVQAVLFVAFGLFGGLEATGDGSFGAPEWTSLGVAIFGFVIFPFVGSIAGRDLAALQTFGIAPDPTVIVTVGLLVTTAHPRWVLFVVPVVWAAFTGATGWVVGSPSAVVAAAAILAGPGIAVWRAVARSS